MIRIEVDTKSLTMAVKDYEEELIKNLRVIGKKSASQMESDAKTEHNFTTRTGRLVKSIKGYYRANKGDDVSVSLVLHDVMHKLGTKYGKYVNKGHGSWSPDRFIERAFVKNVSKLIDGWKTAIDKANRNF